ncbi:MAG: PLP-dependent transferase, partial [Acidihalobacter sp.]
DHVVAVSDLYGGTHRQFENLMRPNFGFDFSYVDGRDPANFEKAIKENTRLFWLETPTNPLLTWWTSKKSRPSLANTRSLRPSTIRSPRRTSSNRSTFSLSPLNALARISFKEALAGEMVLL